jgi:hypothetical protein
LAGQNRFYIIKATNAKAVEVSLTHGLWQFGNQTEKRLLKAIKVILCKGTHALNFIGGGHK